MTSRKWRTERAKSKKKRKKWHNIRWVQLVLPFMVSNITAFYTLRNLLGWKQEQHSKATWTEKEKKSPESCRTKKKMRRWNRRRNFLHSMKEKCDTHAQKVNETIRIIHGGDDDDEVRGWTRMRRMRKIALLVIRIKLFQTYAKVVHILVGWF